MKQGKVVLAIGVMLLLGAVGLGCGSSEEEKAKDRKIAEQREQLERQERMIAAFWVILPLVALVALFVGTGMGLKGKKDAQKNHGANENERQG